MLFEDRRDAGRRLASALEHLAGEPLLVLGVPRGGVVVAYEVARHLHSPLDLLISRKIGAPGNPELAVGAVTQDGTVLADDSLAGYFSLGPEYFEEAARAERLEIQRRWQAYRGRAAFPDVAGKTVVVVDDGVATGLTLSAALRSLAGGRAGRTVVAVPVASRSAAGRLRQEADEVVCLAEPEPFYAVGQFYARFDQTTDEEVRRLLREAASASGQPEDSRS